ncbi:MAG: hypothetical protein QXP05_07005 [Ignisphaera sp.]
MSRIFEVTIGHKAFTAPCIAEVGITLLVLEAITRSGWVRAIVHIVNKMIPRYLL